MKNKKRVVLLLLCPMLAAFALTGCTSEMYELYDLSAETEETIEDLSAETDEESEEDSADVGTNEAVPVEEESEDEESKGEESEETLFEASDAEEIKLLTDVSDTADVYAMLGIWVADENGYFKEAGITVAYTEADPDYMLARVSAGLGDLCISSAEDVILSYADGGETDVLGVALLPQENTDDGDASYDSVLAARAMTADSEPEVIRAFIHAVQAGLTDAAADPSAACKTLKAYLPEESRNLIPDEADLTAVLTDCAGLDEEDDALFGMMDADVWSDAVNELLTEGLIDLDVDPLDCFTNNLL